MILIRYFLCFTQCVSWKYLNDPFIIIVIVAIKYDHLNKYPCGKSLNIFK